MRRYISDSYH